MIEIFNRMLMPSPLKSAATFDYTRDRVPYSRDVDRVHLVFLQVWPDSAGRAWPMKGRISAGDETKLSVHVATIDTTAAKMTVREYLWNRGSAPAWGATRTVALR